MPGDFVNQIPQIISIQLTPNPKYSIINSRASHNRSLGIYCVDDIESKFIRFLKFLRDFKKDSVFPRIANYEITSRCNLNCEHCYWMKSLDSKDELSDEQWREVFIEHKSRGVAFAFLTGGEPSLRLNVIDLVDRVFNDLSIASNGVIKIPEHIKRRIFNKISQGEFSIRKPGLALFWRRRRESTRLIKAL